MTPRLPARFWLSTPSRFAGLAVRDARLALFALVVLMVASLLALGTPLPAAAGEEHAAGGQTDALLYQSIVENVRHGARYYATAADAMRAGGYPLRPFVTMRLPTLAMVQASLPPVVVAGLLYMLAAAVALAWVVRLRGVLIRPLAQAAAMLLLAGGMIVFVQRDLLPFHEIWAGLFLALSLAVWRDDRWLPAIAFGLAAALIRETAGLYLALMAVLALVGGRPREAAGWVAAGVLLSAVLALHAHAVAAVVRPLDLASPGWSGRLGFGFFVQTMTLSTALVLLPAWLAAPLVALSLFGWIAWRDATALRVATLLVAYAVVLSLFGRLDTFYWGLLVTPLLLVGLVFVPDALRDLIAAASDRRRITVKRVVR